MQVSIITAIVTCKFLLSLHRITLLSTLHIKTISVSKLARSLHLLYELDPLLSEKSNLTNHSL